MMGGLCTEPSTLDPRPYTKWEDCVLNPKPSTPTLNGRIVYRLRELRRWRCIVSGAPVIGSTAENWFSPGNAMLYLSEVGEMKSLLAATHLGDMAVCSSCL